MISKKASFSSIDEYIATFPEDRRRLLEELRAAIKAAAPGTEETISYNLPTVTLNGKYLVYFAGWKKHISMYPIPSGDEAFNKEISQYVEGKGTLKFAIDKPLPLDLITKIVKLRLAENLKAAKSKADEGDR